MYQIRSISATIFISFLLQGVVCATPNLPKELPVIRTACERNHCTGDLFIIVQAIRMSENGGYRREFGILHPKCEKQMDLRPNDTLDIQAGWCAATVVKNYQRWKQSGMEQDFIDFLGDRYCPVGAGNDPNGLNRHWVGNVTYWFGKLKGKDNAETN